MRRVCLYFLIFTLVPGFLHAAGSLTLTPGTLSKEVCISAPGSVTLELYNDSTGDSAITLSYSTSSGVGALTGPSSLTLNDGETSPIEVQIISDATSIIGDSFVAEVRASNSVTSTSSSLRILYSRVTGWTTTDSLAVGTRFHAAAYHGGRIYEIGGDLYNGGSPLATGSTRIYDLGAGSWSSGPSMPDPAYGVDAVVLGDLIYVIGGSNCIDDPHDGCDSGSIFQTVRIFDTISETWSTDSADPLPVALAYLTAVSYGGEIYVFGGLDSTAHSVNTVRIYNPGAATGSRWSTGSPMSLARAQAAGVVLNSKIYVAGGWDHGSTVLDALDIYDPSTDSWASGPNMPVAFSSPAGTALDGRFFFLPADEKVSSSYPNTNYTVGSVAYSFDIVENRWIEEGATIYPVYGTQVVSDGTQAWLVSGREKLDLITYGMSTRIDLAGACPVLSSEIFSDGFDNGNLNAWSGVSQ